MDGKALLHDLDQKFESQDRMINYLISQLNSVDQSVQNLNRKAQSISDAERDARGKLEIYSETHDYYSTNKPRAIILNKVILIN